MPEEYAAVICDDCGQVMLSESQYLAQLERYNELWKCPRCGQTAKFDDDYFETHHQYDDSNDDIPF